MTAESFLDTNVLLYASSSAIEDRGKRLKAEELMLNTRFGLSTQVFQEFITNALRTPRLGITETNIDALLSLATRVPVAPITVGLIKDAVAIRRRFEIGHWDAAIVAAARALHCRTLYSEDLSDGQDYGGVMVVNPFN